MCRNIKPLFNFDPPATDEEIHDAVLQFVRKISGFQKLSEVNQEVFDKAVEEMSVATKTLLNKLVTNAPHRDREVEIKKAKERSSKRYGK